MNNVTPLRRRRDNDKYVVFKTEDFMRVLAKTTPETALGDFGDVMIEDAFVIRQQDQFAEVGLYAYGAALHSVAQVLESFGNGEMAETVAHLYAVSDLAAGMADTARQQDGGMPT